MSSADRNVGYFDCFSCLKLPTKTHGRWALVRGAPFKMGHPFEVLTVRDAILLGEKPFSVRSPRREVIHALYELRKGDADPAHGRLWMSDHPAEVWSHVQALKGFHGRVLVGGLGIGLAVSILTQNPNVESITVVEKSRDVRALVEPHVKSSKTKIITSDLFKWLSRKHPPFPVPRKPLFDFAFYDIWIGTGEYNLWNRVMPLRMLSRGLVPSENISCWKEPFMLGQVNLSIKMAISMRHVQLPGSVTPDLFSCPEDQFLGARDSLGPKWAFYNWARQEKVEHGVVLEAKLPDFIHALTDMNIWQDCWAKYYGKEIIRGQGRNGE